MPEQLMDTLGFDLNRYVKGGCPTEHQRRRLAMVQRLLAGCGPRTLDYGCGFGDIAYAISAGRDIVAVDVDADRVAFAAREFAPLHFEVCAPDVLQFDDEQFDTVVSSVVIHWVNNPDLYLREAWRVLAPGGHMVLLIQNVPVINNVLRGCIGLPAVKQKFWNESYTAMLSRLARHGFAAESTDCFYESPREVNKHFKDWIVHALQLPFRLLRTPSLAPYYGLRLRKVPVPVAQSALSQEQSPVCALS